MVSEKKGLKRRYGRSFGSVVLVQRPAFSEEVMAGTEIRGGGGRGRLHT